jgi:hypothetical protein
MREIRRAAVVLVALSVLLTGVPLSLASASHIFGGAAGWEKASSSRRPVLVWGKRNLGVDVRGSIAPWNWLAGWQLFRQARNRRSADVVFRLSKSPQTWTECPPSYMEPFHLCIVWVADPAIQMTRHELGHTLGFADHIPAAVHAEDTHVSAKVCDISDHPQFSAYHGVMSYCDWRDGERGWFGPKDSAMLKRAGYLNAETLDLPGRAGRDGVGAGRVPLHALAMGSGLRPLAR